MTASISDVIDHLAGIAAGSPTDRIRAGRPQTRTAAQESFRLLLEPDEPGAVSRTERRAVAAFVAALHGDRKATDFYAGLLAADTSPDLVATIHEEAARAAASGPYGRYPAGPLSAEDVEGPVFAVSAQAERALGGRLARGLEHAHLLVFHPRDAGAAELQRLLDAGWTEDAAVTLSQLVSFLAFQIRAAVGLRALVEASAPVAEPA